MLGDLWHLVFFDSPSPILSPTPIDVAREVHPIIHASHVIATEVRLMKVHRVEGT